MYFEVGARGASARGAKTEWPYAPRSDEELVCLASEMARYDPRLLGVLVELLVTRWRSLNPLRLREAMHAMRAPQTVCVALEFARAANRDLELGLFASYVGAGIPRAHPVAHFFVDDVRPGTRLAESRAGRSLAPYSRWGFLGVERPTFDPFRKSAVGRYDAATRRDVLRRLLSRRGDAGVSIAEYRDAVDDTISRQQARADLEAEGLRPSGRGPGTRWSSAKPRRGRRA
jgi:hypothetical protein